MSKNVKKIRIYSALEVANICGVVNQTAINWIKQGYLQAFSTPGGQYRVYAEDLLKFLKERGMRVPNELLENAKAEGLEVKVLIVDDDEELNNLIKTYIQRKFPDYTIQQAFDGLEAGKMLAEEKPTVIILDIDLPGIDGHKICKKIKDDSSLDNPVIISITGMNDPAVKEQILKEGADAFFPKPLDMEDLGDFIMTLEKRSRR